MNVIHTVISDLFFLIVFVSLIHSHNQPISIFLEQPHILQEFSLFSPFLLSLRASIVLYFISLRFHSTFN